VLEPTVYLARQPYSVAQMEDAKIPPEAAAITARLSAAQRQALGDQLLALYLFGSAATGSFEASVSDVDLLVEMAEDRGFGDYLALVEELERVLARRVDLVTERGLSPHFRPFIEAEAQPL